jgi:inorganic phosphate transporter, PiT family
VGVGTVRKVSAVRWGVAGSVVWAWVFTVPGSAAISASALLILRAVGVPV